MIASSTTSTAPRSVWPTLPRRSPALSPLENILGEPACGAFTPTQIESLRSHAARSIPPLPVPELDAFLGTLMDCSDTVSAYFRPTRVFTGGVRQPLVQLVLPFECALQAAAKAAAMPTLLPQERALAWIAAFAYPLPLFYIADTARGAGAYTEAPTPEYVAATREVLLEDALRMLRGHHRALADTLAATLGVGDVEGCDQQQVARVASAVRLAVLRIEQLWKDVGDV